MSSRLKKRTKVIGVTNAEIKSVYKQDKSIIGQNNMIRDSFRRLSLIGCYVIHDEFGFAEKRIKKYVYTISDTMEKWYANEFPTQAFMMYAEKKKYDYRTWVNRIPTTQKISIANGKVNRTNGLDTRRTLESAFMLFGLISIVVLKEEFRMSNNQLDKFFDSLIDCVDSYCRKDYGKETYLSDKRIHETILEECNFDISKVVFSA